MLHKNLLSLKAYEGDVSELGLYFTIVCDELGETREEDLKPNGSNIPVTSANRLEYIQLMADFKLNKQIRKQCMAFRQGLSNVLPIQWLYMFSNKELQVLISGAEIPVDIDDLRLHTRYSGDFSTEHPTIICFWKVIQKFNDIQRRQLLKFVTSCSRPPLLGFKVKYFSNQIYIAFLNLFALIDFCPFLSYNTYIYTIKQKNYKANILRTILLFINNIILMCLTLIKKNYFRIWILLFVFKMPAIWIDYHPQVLV